MEKEKAVDSRIKVLDKIQATMAGDIEAMNGIIRSLLHTDHDLVNSIVENYLVTKGKQIRPILVMLAARMFGEINERVLYCAAALEMLHNATLIHDDVVDQTPLRRGKPTINAVWGNNIAVLVGDLFVSKALEGGNRTGDIEILQSLSDLGTELSLGEMSQLFNARNHDFNDAAYLAMIAKKTASLFTGCVRIGAQAVGAPKEEMEVLQKYAYLMGMAFQIRDDVFDYFPSDDIGKPSGHDLLEGKVTLPLLHAIAVAPAGESEKVREILSRDEIFIEKKSKSGEIKRVNIAGGIRFCSAEYKDGELTLLIKLSCDESLFVNPRHINETLASELPAVFENAEETSCRTDAYLADGETLFR